MAKNKVIKKAGEKTPVGPRKLPSFITQGPAIIGKMKRRNIPQIVKPADIPIGSTITGTILDVLRSPKASVKGVLLHMSDGKGNEYSLPVTGSIRQALVPGVKRDTQFDEIKKLLTPEIGRKFAATRLEDGFSDEFKKNMYRFDVFTADAE